MKNSGDTRGCPDQLKRGGLKTSGTLVGVPTDLNGGGDVVAGCQEGGLCSSGTFAFSLVYADTKTPAYAPSDRVPPRPDEAAKVQTQEIVHRIFFHPIGPGCIQVVSARSLPCLGRLKFVFSRNPCRVFHESTLIFSKIIT